MRAAAQSLRRVVVAACDASAVRSCVAWRGSLSLPRAGADAAPVRYMSKAPGGGRKRARSDVEEAPAVADALPDATVAEQAAASAKAEADAMAVAAEATAAAQTAPALNHPYGSQISYSSEYATDVRNPVEHTFAHAGKYFPLLADASDAALLPEGIAGDLPTEFSTTGSSSMLVRPLGVALVQHLEAWRQAHGRTLAAGGARVLDIDPAAAYTPKQLTTPRVRGMMVAEQMHGDGVEEAAVEAIDIPFRPLRLLTGPQGIGKSALLTYIVMYARRNGWLALFVPNSFEIMNKGLVLVPSKRRPGFVDQHDMALRMLKTFLAANASLLERIPQRGKYAVFRYLPHDQDVIVSAERDALRKREDDEKSRAKATAEAKGEVWDASSFVSKYENETDMAIDRSAFTLKHMVEWGIAHPSAATDTLLDVISELRSVTEFPVLIAVDGLNLMYEGTDYPLVGEGRNLAAEELSIPSALHCLSTDGFRKGFALARGVYIATITQKHGQRMRMFEAANVRDRFRVRVPELTREELHSQLMHYHATQKFLMVAAKSSVDAFAVEYYRTLCSGVPGEVYKAAMYHDAVRNTYEVNKAKRNRMRHAGMQ